MVTLLFLQYLPPARPNDIPIHNVSMEVIESNWSDVVNYTYYLTVIPATCDSDIPLISITLLDTEENSTGMYVCMYVQPVIGIMAQYEPIRRSSGVQLESSQSG